MLANYRCSEIKAAALQSVEMDIYELIGSSNTISVNDFKNKCDIIQQKVLCNTFKI